MRGHTNVGEKKSDIYIHNLYCFTTLFENV